MGEYRDPKSVNYTNYHRLAVLGECGGGVTKEITTGYWSGEWKVDIRKWKDGCLGKGISLTKEEADLLSDVLCAMEFGET